jgi:hypothetical protein
MLWTLLVRDAIDISLPAMACIRLPYLLVRSFWVNSRRHLGITPFALTVSSLVLSSLPGIGAPWVAKTEKVACIMTP